MAAPEDLGAVGSLLRVGKAAHRTPVIGKRKPGRVGDWMKSQTIRASLAVAVFAVVASGGCGGRSYPGGPSTGEGIVHVHGLGVNPADGKLYVATHTGLFRLEPKPRTQDGGTSPHEAISLGESKWDFMGFTVVGPDHFLASGHPDLEGMRAGEQKLLGLIESRDGGRTWQKLSLGGQADFHALRVLRGRIYGYNSSSGRLMTSEDGKDWEELSQVLIFDFSVDGARPERLVATTNEGLVVSLDGGRSWSAPRPPVLAYLDWSAGSFWGVGPDGAVYRSSGGENEPSKEDVAAAGGAEEFAWQEVGRAPGAPVAFLVSSGTFYVATSDASVFVSHNSGVDWTPIYSSGRGH